VFGVCVVDQASKALVRETLTVGERISVLPGLLDLLHVKNTGVAWGVFTGHPLRLPLVTFLSLATLLVLLGWYWRLHADERALAWSLALVVAGAAGNFIDRLLYRQVTDFVQLSAPGPLAPLTERLIGSSSWAVFNIADVSITFGLVLFFALAVRGRVIPPGLAPLPNNGSIS